MKELLFKFVVSNPKYEYENILLKEKFVQRRVKTRTAIRGHFDP